MVGGLVPMGWGGDFSPQEDTEGSCSSHWGGILVSDPRSAPRGHVLGVVWVRQWPVTPLALLPPPQPSSRPCAAAVLVSPRMAEVSGAALGQMGGVVVGHCQVAGAAVTKYRRLGDFNNRRLFSHSSGEAKSPRSGCEQGWLFPRL